MNNENNAKKSISQKERIRATKANEWLNKYLRYYEDAEYIKHLIHEYYLTNAVRDNEEGIIFFSPYEVKKVVGAENMSYDEYIHIQLQHYSKRFDFITMIELIKTVYELD